jgi:predicted DCC family thiol-disulfide oxidoreductase YuxK
MRRSDARSDPEAVPARTMSMTDTCQKTIYFDGACPLCSLEIAHYQRQAGSENLCFLDVSQDGTNTGTGLTQDAALARFHVRARDGSLLSGAAAFVAVWDELPSWRWAARLARLPGVLPVLELGYRAFLPLRPGLAALLRRRGRG